MIYVYMYKEQADKFVLCPLLLRFENKPKNFQWHRICTVLYTSSQSSAYSTKKNETL